MRDLGLTCSPGCCKRLNRASDHPYRFQAKGSAPESPRSALWLLGCCARAPRGRTARARTRGGAVPAINSFCARDGSSPGAWPNSSHDLAHTAHEIPLPHTHTPFKSQTGNLPGQLVQTLPAKLENLKQREKLRHCLQETRHTPQTGLHLSSPHLSAPALFK